MGAPRKAKGPVATGPQGSTASQRKYSSLRAARADAVLAHLDAAPFHMVVLSPGLARALGMTVSALDGAVEDLVASGKVRMLPGANGVVLVPARGAP